MESCIEPFGVRRGAGSGLEDLLSRAARGEGPDARRLGEVVAESARSGDGPGAAAALEALASVSRLGQDPGLAQAISSQLCFDDDALARRGAALSFGRGGGRLCGEGWYIGGRLVSHTGGLRCWDSVVVMCAAVAAGADDDEAHAIAVRHLWQRGGLAEDHSAFSVDFET